MCIKNYTCKIIHNYNNTFNRGIGFTPQEAHDNGLIQSKIVNDAIDKTNNIESNDKKEKFKIGDLCRILKSKELFDKMNTNYSKEIYRIVGIKKNNVSVSLLTDDNKIYHNIKKKYVQIITENDNYLNPIIDEKEAVEKEHKVKTKLKKVAIEENNIIREPRVKKAREILDL